VDAVASPFVQGQLRNEPLSVTIESECACCGRPMRIDTDGRSSHRFDEGARPLVFFPLVDFGKWKDRSIIDGF
jgi:hypothetical protein